MLTMKQITNPKPPVPQRIGVAEAKAKLSEVLRDLPNGITIIHNRGRDLAVLLTIDHYNRIVGEQTNTPGAGAFFMDRVETIKQRHGGGIDHFEPPPLQFDMGDPDFNRLDVGRKKS